MTHDDVSALLALAKANWPRMEISAATVSLWSTMLGDMSRDEALRALQAHVAESPHWPTVADLRRRAAAATVTAMPAELVWGEVQRAIGSHGMYRTPTFGDPCLTEAVEAIGWVSICTTDVSQTGTLRAQLRDAYAAASERRQRQANVGRLEAHQEARRLETRAGGPAPIAQLVASVRR